MGLKRYSSTRIPRRTMQERDFENWAAKCSLAECGLEDRGRTTIQLRNIPRRYTQRQLFEDLAAKCSLEACDFFVAEGDAGEACDVPDFVRV